MTCPFKDISLRALTALNRKRVVFPERGTIRDVIRFGFSFIESEDNMVAYVIALPCKIKDILCEFSESELDPKGEVLGRLWTAELICTKRLKDNQIIFANQDFNAVLILDIPNIDERSPITRDFLAGRS